MSKKILCLNYDSTSLCILSSYAKKVGADFEGYSEQELSAFKKAVTSASDQENVVVLVDLNADAYAVLDSMPTAHMYVTSASIHPLDILRAKEDPRVIDYLVQPIGKDKLAEIAA